MNQRHIGLFLSSGTLLLLSIFLWIYLTVLQAAGLKPNVSVVVFLSTEGIFDWDIADDVMSFFWKETLETKSSLESWLVNVTVEIVDVKSDPVYMKSWAVSRVNNSTLPPVGVFIFNTLGYEQQDFFRQFKIPCIISAVNPNAYNQNLDQGSSYQYSFFIEPAVQYYFRELALKYVEMGVKTLAVVVDLGDHILNPNIDWSYSGDSCIRTAHEVMAPLGITLVGDFSYYIETATRDDYVSIVNKLKILNPDALMICNPVITLYPELLNTFILKLMREMDYNAKAVHVLDLAGSIAESVYLPEGTLDYVTEVTFSHQDLSGIDFTEDSAPYSSTFTQGTPVTVADGLIAGSNIPSHPSSAKLFHRWYKDQVGFNPSYLAVGIWAAFDVVESALWHAGNSKSMRADGVIDASEVMDMLLMTNAATPYGRVVFDYNRINTKSYASVIQWRDSNDNTSIVAPGNLATSSFVYPMPTWKERVYEWSILKGFSRRCIIVVIILSSLLIALMVTIISHRQERDIKMLHTGHMVAMLIASLVVLWALVFIWQGDVTQPQCNALLWTVYWPASFIIQLTNMKAYRLSVFLTSRNINRLRKLSHHRILLLTLGWVSFTSFLLMVAQLVDPPVASRIVVDQFRPAQDYHICRFGATTHSILYLLVAVHVVMSTFCVVIVRNGSEAFKDGLLMKEAFIALFSCIAITYIFGQLGLSPQSFYLLRTVFIGVGVTVFCCRLLLGRCVKYWIPSVLVDAMMKYYKAYESIQTKYFGATSKVAAIEILVGHAVDDYPVMEAPLVADIDEMTKVLRDEIRGPLFRAIAKKSLVLENVQFLDAVDDLTEKYAEVLTQVSIPKELVNVAHDLFQTYCESGSELEVNISDATRAALRQELNLLSQGKGPFISKNAANYIIREDLMGLGSLMKKATSEIRSMLFQNIWSKFRAAETELQMSIPM